MQQLLIQINISTLALKPNIAISKKIKTTSTAVVFYDLFGLLLYSAMFHVEILFPSLLAMIYLKAPKIQYILQKQQVCLKIQK